VADGVCHGHHGEAEGDGNAKQAYAYAREPGGVDGAAAAAEDQPEGADELRNHPDTQRHVFISPFAPKKKAARGGLWFW
jgi:hypothetical protein